MKPINYSATIPVYREYRFPTIKTSGLTLHQIGVNTIVRKIEKSKWEKVKKHLHFWALMLGISNWKDK